MRWGEGNAFMADSVAIWLFRVLGSLSLIEFLIPGFRILPQKSKLAAEPFCMCSSLTLRTVQAKAGRIVFLKKNNPLYNGLHFF